MLKEISFGILIANIFITKKNKNQNLCTSWEMNEKLFILLSSF